MSKLDEFLAGERHDDVALFLTHEYLDSEGKLPNMGVEVDDGYVLVVPGDDGRRAFAAGTGMDAMEFSRGAMDRRGHVDRRFGGGECPERDDGENHRIEFIFGFSEERNEEVGGLYARGDVVHAYAHCACGVNYSDKWVVGEESETGVQPGDDEPAEATE